MNFEEDKVLLETYNRLKIKFSSRFDSFEAVKTVIRHRNFWKPTKIKTMLLAESHVFTPNNELSQIIKYPESVEFVGIPEQFVRLVYCLGYGENALAPSIDNNRGTSQFWKVFAACASDNPNSDYAEILIGGTAYAQRLLNKVRLLKTLKEKGVWLVDCSIVGLYVQGKKKPSGKVMKEIVQICWDSYISKIVESEKPGHIIVVGYMVADPLWERLYKMGIPFTKLPQPQAHFSAETHEEALRTYQEICNRQLQCSL